MNVKVTLKRSKIGCTKSQKATLACLGLKKINQSRSFKETPAFLGQINKVRHLVVVESDTSSARPVKKKASSVKTKTSTSKSAKKPSKTKKEMSK